MHIVWHSGVYIVKSRSCCGTLSVQQFLVKVLFGLLYIIVLLVHYIVVLAEGA